MMKDQVLFSICVPTYKREYIVRDMLKSIYSQGVDTTLFEVCITDNSETDETKDMLEKEFSGIPNLRYKKTTCKGFLNSQEALKFGRGKFLKLHNDYSIFKTGSLRKMISLVEKYEKDKPEIFFSMGELKNDHQVEEFTTFDDFMYNIHYFSTWSTSFSIWKEDLDALLQEGVDVNYMYPHTTLLYRMTGKKLYVVDDYEYVENLQPKKKGGYNLIDNFVRIYLTMVREDLLDRKIITQKTFDKIQKNIIRFTAFWYYTVKHDPEHFTFTFENYEQLILSNCGKKFLSMFRMYYAYFAMKAFVKKILRKA